MSFERVLKLYSNFVSSDNKSFACELYKEVSKPLSVYKMITAISRGDVAIAGIAEELEEKFDFSDLRSRRALGVITAEIL
jgi:hypothetical protein